MSLYLPVFLSWWVVTPTVQPSLFPLRLILLITLLGSRMSGLPPLLNLAVFFVACVAEALRLLMLTLLSFIKPDELLLIHPSSVADAGEHIIPDPVPACVARKTPSLSAVSAAQTEAALKAFDWSAANPLSMLVCLKMCRDFFVDF